MIWWQTWGKNYDALLEMERRGVRVAALDSAPAYRGDIAVFLRCFEDVAADRSMDGQITFRAVAHWCQLYGVPIADCWEIVRMADQQVRTWQSSRSTSSAPPRTSKPSR